MIPSKRKGFVVAVVAALFVVSICFCVREHKMSPATAHSNALGGAASTRSEIESNATRSNSVIPKNFQFASVTERPEVDSLDAWLARFPQVDQVKLRRFSDLYFGVYNVTSPAQIKWMEEHGYPLPEDVLAASMSTIAELRDMAAQGNDKAKMLLFDRLIDEYAEKRDAFTSSGRPRLEFNSSDGQDLVQEILQLQGQLDNINSPFAQLVKTRNYELLENSDVITSDATRISGILAAHQLGDIRSTAMLRDCVSAGVCSAEDVEVATATVLAVNKAGALNGSRSGCSQLPTTLMPSN